ncbi:alpha/beta-hydrolase [Agrocybe pediades]|nr:alpha/beta-hydrolase [Agrocybe pediades]
MATLRWSLLLLYTAALAQATTAFHPKDYSKRTTTCKASRRGVEKEDIVDIDIKYVNVNSAAPQTLLMVHGWPGLWSTWSKQIQGFERDYHLVVPDLRGFAESSHPGEVQSSGSLPDIVDDLICVLDDANVSSAICIGHDWGSSICYEAARLRPDRIKAVVGAVVPYVPSAGDFLPIKELVPMLPTLTYQLFFDSQPKAAAMELDRDVRRTIRATLRTVASPPPDDFLKDKESFLSAWDGVEEIAPVPFFTPEEEDYFVEQYSLNGFKNTLYFYSDENRRRGWQLANSQGNHTITQPVLAIYPTEDPVANWAHLAKMLGSEQHLPHLTTHVMPGAHWVNLEHPEEFNTAVRKWLDSLPPLPERNDNKHDEL